MKLEMPVNMDILFDKHPEASFDLVKINAQLNSSMLIASSLDHNLQIPENLHLPERFDKFYGPVTLSE